MRSRLFKLYAKTSLQRSDVSRAPGSMKPACFILYVMLSASASVVILMRLSPTLTGCAEITSLMVLAPRGGMMVLRHTAAFTVVSPS